MTTMIGELDGYKDAVDILTYMMVALSNKRARTTPSRDKGSDFQKLSEAIEDVIDARLALEAQALKAINAAIAASGVIAEIDAAATDAKTEADRIKKATKVVDGLVSFVDEIVSHVGLVGKILAL